MKTIGLPLDRADGPAKVKGEAHYAADFSMPRIAHAVLVLSAIPSGRATSFTTAPVERMPGVIKILTPLNAPRLAKRAANSQLRELSLLQDSDVHYNAQPLAVVVAETLEQARDAAARIEIAYERSPAKLDFELLKSSAIKPEKANQHPTDMQWGSFEAGLKEADVIVDATYSTPSQNHNPLEPHATVAEWKGEKLVVHDSTQGVFACRATLAAHFGIAPEQVRVISPFIGGGFGCKGSAWSHVVLCAMAARATGRPVKLALDRSQMFGQVGGRPRTEQHVQLGARADGTLLAVRHAVITQSSMLENWVEPSAAQTRILYACANGDTSHRLVKLNVGTPTYQRAPGEASGTFALEVAMDELATKLAIDPIELRVRNYADKSPSDGKPFSEKSLRECYSEGAKRFGWARRDPRARSMRDGTWQVGYGMATATYPANRSKAMASATLRADGSALVRSGTQDIGTGTYTVMAQVAAETLGLPVARVTFELGDTEYPEAPVSGGSQSAVSVANAVQAACGALRDKLLDAALAGEHSPFAKIRKESLAVDDGWVMVRERPSRRESFASILARGSADSIEAHAESVPSEQVKNDYALHSFGAAFAEVRVDPDLGLVRLQRLHGTYDIGRVLNEKLARSQLIGGMVWAASFALFEESLLDATTGRVVNANLSEYLVPTNADIGEVDVAFVRSEDLRLSPLGIRGIGEIGITGMAAAIANAVHHATGVRLRDLPIRLQSLLDV